MNTRILLAVFLAGSFMLLASCRQRIHEEVHIRPLADTVGFAHLDWQMDSVMARIQRCSVQDPSATFHFEGIPRVVIAPHDDYAYVCGLYPAALRNIKAGTVILFGVAHKAKLLGIENQVVFDSYDAWKGPYGLVMVSGIREEIIGHLPRSLFQVNDSLQRLEHSVEALIPFLQYENRDVRIVSILVPTMPFDRMRQIADTLSVAIRKATSDKGMVWGKDFTFVISTDAVHYGDEDWGGRNFAVFGTDSAGFAKVLSHELEIMDTLSGTLGPGKIRAFHEFTVDDRDLYQYKWTWCGRFSVPLGLLTAYELNDAIGSPPLNGSIIGYSNSINHEAIRVEDLKMGRTAPANLHHWVGYAAVGYN